MNIQLTSHARARLAERLPGIRALDYDQVVLNAWSSRETSQTLLFLRQQNSEPRYRIKYKYRLRAGMVYVFRYHHHHETVQLITLFRHQSPESTMLYQDFNRWAEA